ncbi:MAG: type III secretion system effector protein [Pirellulales bacterium]|nr:type III secretion system effector protein [Pirellulales bacterium]
MKRFSQIIISGTKSFCRETSKLLHQIARHDIGWKLLEAIERRRRFVTIVESSRSEGNMSFCNDDGCPVLLRAKFHKDEAQFCWALHSALSTALRRGITLEHMGRQLCIGYTPAMYSGVRTNTVRPLIQSTPEADASAHITTQTAIWVDYLLGLAGGSQSLSSIPPLALAQLPRLLRDHLDPGPGSDVEVRICPSLRRHCSQDPAMRNRPPAIGLAHELIHALHAVTGTSMKLASTDGRYRESGEPVQKLEEVITTGLPPYNFEPFSDNKFRALWHTPVLLRMKY